MDLTQHHRTYTLNGSTLQLARSPRHGSIVTSHGTWPVQVVRWRGLAVEAEGAVRLESSGAVVPDGPARWEVTGNSVSVARDGARIVVREKGFLRKSTTVEVTGEWADRDLVVLTACFALVARRRRRKIMMIVAASSHGGVS
jgi:hypothetical protein